MSSFCYWRSYPHPRHGYVWWVNGSFFYPRLLHETGAWPFNVGRCLSRSLKAARRGRKRKGVGDGREGGMRESVVRWGVLEISQHQQGRQFPSFVLVDREGKAHTRTRLKRRGLRVKSSVWEEGEGSTSHGIIHLLLNMSTKRGKKLKNWRRIMGPLRDERRKIAFLHDETLHDCT